jgi:hypothetical protein
MRNPRAMKNSLWSHSHSPFVHQIVNVGYGGRVSHLSDAFARDLSVPPDSMGMGILAGRRISDLHISQSSRKAVVTACFSKARDERSTKKRLKTFSYPTMVVMVGQMILACCLKSAFGGCFL